MANRTDQPPEQPTPTPPRILSDAAELVRQFNHASISPSEDWQYPSHAYDALGALAHLVRMLAQAIEQAVRPATRVYEHGRLAIDGGGDPDEAVRRLQTAVGTAVASATVLSGAVDAMHSATSSMGLDTRGLR